MIFITGGAYQGKLSYAKREYSLSDAEIADCSSARLPTFNEKRCITNLQFLVKPENVIGEQKAVELIKKFISAEKNAHSDFILIMDEVGSGIVPIEKADRDYREAAGRLGCYIAEHADTVIRVTCGIGQRIK